MPTYDYRCEHCGYTFEQYQKFSDEPLKKCPECKKKKLIKVTFATMPNIIIRGEPTTVGQIAERNTKYTSKELIAARAAQQQERIEGELPPGMTRAKPPNIKEPEWYTKPRTATTKEVAKMTPEKQQKYIVTGEK